MIHNAEYRAVQRQIMDIIGNEVHDSTHPLGCLQFQEVEAAADGIIELLLRLRLVRLEIVRNDGQEAP